MANGSWRRPVAVLAVVGALALVAGPAAADPFPVDEPFAGTSFADPDWVLPDGAVNSAELTGDVLRLTPSDPGFQQGNATLDDAFRSDVAFTMDFDYAAYGGGNPGDAMTVFLMDGAQAPNLGQTGGAAGYVSLQGGYVAVGLDNAGNFAADTVFGPQANSVVLRGAGAATGGEGWPVLTREPAPGGTVASDPAAPRHVHVEVEPSGDDSIFLTVQVSPPGGGALVTVYDHVDVRSFGRGQPARPATFKLGFTAGTGGATNNYEVSSFQASADVDLAVTKTGPAAVDAGGAVTWTVGATNDDTNPVEDAVLTDTVPAGLTAVTWSCVSPDDGVCPTPASGTASAGGTISVPLVLLRDQAATLTVTATAPDALAGSSITNTATIGADSRTELTPSDNTATWTTRVRALPDLAASVSAQPSPIVLGGSVSWTVDVANLASADGDAPDAALHVDVPAIVDLDSVTPPTGCARTGGGFVCSLGAIAAGGSTSVAFSGATTDDAAACVAGPATFTATVTTSLTDADPDNDTGTATVSCTVPVDLSITKSAPAALTVGDDVTWSVVVADPGPLDAPGTTITDTIPAGVEDVAWTCVTSDGAPCAPASGTGDVSTTVTVPAGGTVAVTITGRTTSAGPVVNAASATACDACTADPATVTASASTTVAEAVVPPTPTEPGGSGASSGGGSLATTGTDAAAGALGALAMVVVGVACVVATRGRGASRG